MSSGPARPVRATQTAVVPTPSENKDAGEASAHSRAGGGVAGFYAVAEEAVVAVAVHEAGVNAGTDDVADTAERVTRLTAILSDALSRRLAQLQPGNVDRSVPPLD